MDDYTKSKEELIRELDWLRNQLSEIRDLDNDRDLGESLEEASAHYHEFFNSVFEGLCIIDENHNIQYGNPALLRILEEDSLGNIKGQSILNYVPYDQLKIVESQLEQRLSGQPTLYELDILTGKGTYKTVLLSGTPRRDKAGRYKGAFGSMIDITERKKATEEVINSEKKFRMLMETAVEAISWISRDGIFLQMNKNAAGILGGKPDDFIGKSIKDVFPGDSAVRQMEIVKDAIINNKTLNLTEETIIGEEIRWIHAIVQPIEDSKGMVSSVQLIATDITEQKRNNAREKARFDLLNRVRTSYSIDDCLSYACRAIYEALLFERAAMTIHNDKKEILYIGHFGLDGNTVIAAKNSAAPDDKLSRKMTQEEFRISNSYFIPSESGVFTEEFGRQIKPTKDLGAAGLKWKANDEFFVPLLDKSGKIIGWLSVDTPFDGNRPSYDIAIYIEELVDIACRKILEIIGLETLDKERITLQEKNIALREVMGHIEAEKTAIRQQIINKVDNQLLPILKKIKIRDGSLSLVYYELLKKGLEEIADSAGGAMHLYSKLSSREAEICNMIKDGATSNNIARAFKITVATVHKHREVIRKKLGLTNRNINLTSFLKSH